MRISVDETIKEIADIRSQIRQLERRCCNSYDSNFEFYADAIDALDDAEVGLHNFLDYWS